MNLFQAGHSRRAACLRLLLALVALHLCMHCGSAAASEPLSEGKHGPKATIGTPTLRVEWNEEKGRLAISTDGVIVAEYVYADPDIPRPYFAHVKTQSGQQVTRNFPPIEGIDKMDHVQMHPGLWLSFGDLNGHDFWRLGAVTEHVRFEKPPTVEGGAILFTVVNQYRPLQLADGEVAPKASHKVSQSHAALRNRMSDSICQEVCTFRIVPMPSGYAIDWRSQFTSLVDKLEFGDQEEMGLGIRLASSIAVEKKLGGRILDNEGRRNAAEVWGQPVAWCDYAGPLGEKWAGITAFSSPSNFRQPWAHARDYGYLALNPFALKAFTKAESSNIVLRQGETLELQFVLYIHETSQELDFGLAQAANDVSSKFFADSDRSIQ